MLFPTPSISENRVDFNLNRWASIIEQKGVRVIVKKALQCPCKTQSLNAVSSCQNCGGTGWLFVNPRETRMVLQGMGITQDTQDWTRLVTGQVRISAMPEEELSFLDKIIRLDGESIFSEVLYFKTVNTLRFAFSSYDIKSIDYIGLFVSPSTPLQRLVVGRDFTFEKNRIKLTDDFVLPDDEFITATIRYKHAPVLHIFDNSRETVDNMVYKGGKEELQYLPVSAIARRPHQIPELEKLTGPHLLNNDFSELT